MPVSTRSQFNVIQDQNEEQRSRMRNDQENNQLGNLHHHHQLRNPHHGLKEKMKALTQLYEQQKLASNALRNPSPIPNKDRFSTHPSVDLLSGGGSCKGDTGKRKNSRESESNVMRENAIPSSTVTKTYVLPRPPLPVATTMEEDTKENVAVVRGGGGGGGGGGNAEKIVGFSCPRRGVVSTTVARKLSMGSSVAVPEPSGEIGGGGGHGGGGGGGAIKNVSELEGVTEKLSNVGSRILVFVRLRPLSKKEREAGSRSCVRIVNRKDVYLTEFANENDYLRLKRLRGRHFTFDASFPDSSSQLEVYSASTAELVEAVLQGRNGSVFCYGATGAGKTYTMLGTVENPGVMVLAIKDLFNKVRQRSCDGNQIVHLSYLEVYNETVRDLLSPGRPLILREDKQGIVAAGLTQYRAFSTDEVMSLLQQGNRNRTTEPTRANETSSRSHAILQVMVEYRVKDDSNNVISRVGKLSLIDLAGSERALATDQRTLRSLEGANINRSLLALSSCINALVEGKKHIPYRNSKLTQLLKDSLGGACNTVMIANISPSSLSFSETQNTLHWADRAKEIRTKACEANEEILQIPESETNQAKLLLELQKENRDLRVQLARQQQKLLTIQAQSLAAASPTPSTISSILSTPPSTCKPKDKRKGRPSFLTSNCFTPESKKKGAEETVKELKQTVKTLEAAMEKMKKDHALQMKQKDDLIREISRKSVKKPEEGIGEKRVVTRAGLKPKEATEGELKSPSSRFLSPAATAKKRSFWDITTANSPSVVSLNGRKTRSHIVKEPAAAAPSMLLQLAYPCLWFVFMFAPHAINYIMQPGFARQRPESTRH